VKAKLPHIHGVRNTMAYL